jgi:hypothetical protein
VFTFFGVRRTRPTSLRTTLRLTTLDCRNAPSDLLGTEIETPVPSNGYYVAPDVDPSKDDDSSFWSGLNYADPPAGANKPPVIYLTSVVVNTGGTVTVSGYVVDENPAGLAVTYGSGSITAFNGSTTTNANGTFSITVALNGQAGEIWAETADAQGLASNVAYRNIP